MSSVPSVTAAEAARLMAEEDYAYVDVRSVTEFELGHVEGAFNLPVQAPEFLALAHGIAKRHKGLVVGCHTGVRSRRACEALHSDGVDPVVEHHAGFAGCRDEFGQLLEPGWERAGFAVSYQALPGHSYGELCDADEG